MNFHVSRSPIFLRNLQKILRRPTLWDNLCLAVDEQILFRDRREHELYLETLALFGILRPH